MNPTILSYFGDLLQNLPSEAFDALSLLLLAVLVIAIIVGVMGIMSSLLEITMYAVLTVVGVGGFFFLTDYIDVSGAISLVTNAIEWLLSLL